VTYLSRVPFEPASERPLPQRRSAWRFFPWAVAGSLGFVMFVNAGLVWSALSTFPGAAGNDGFDLSNDYDRLLAIAEKQAALGWSIAAALRDGRPALTFLDRSGQPITGLVITGDAERPLGPPLTTTLHFASEAPGTYVADERLPEAGPWDVLITAGADAARFRATKRLIVK